MSCGVNKKDCCKGQCNRKPIDYVVCVCMGVLYSEIREEIAKGAHTFEELSSRLGVGTGCNSCVQEVHQILQSELQKKVEKS